jgi:outer membrane biosynthesis protein TonB
LFERFAFEPVAPVALVSLNGIDAMMKPVLFACVLLASPSAFAQTTTTTDPMAPASPPTTTATQPPDTAPPTNTEPATPATPSDPSATEPATPATPATPAEPSQTARTTDENSSDTVAATVEADWAKYDTNKGDSLSRKEFGKWVTDLQSAAGKKAPTSGYLSAAFKKADADKNGSISKDELQTFLRG